MGVAAKLEVWQLSVLFLLNRYADECLWASVAQKALEIRLKPGENFLHAP